VGHPSFFSLLTIGGRRYTCPPEEKWATRRFNNRKNPYLFRDTMLKLIHSENLEYKELTKAA
jgi:hypothetical protein